jgi:hypothetical protein
VRLLLTKRQLDSLKTVLDGVLTAGRDNQISGESFFTSLKNASTLTAGNPDALANVKNLGESALIPKFLAGLPYHSQLMDMSNDLWASWGPDEQDSFLNSVEAKVKAYSSLHDNPEIWKPLNTRDDPADFVTQVPLGLLP